ncbi:unnamed protein product [Rotaria sordida]|uniref:DUF6570 domain-containing protein n=1 Tax=Rotaria sordida TaxID=392033 RepID=A0A814TNP7_9BILA|nr:unnamed protein product [Rotaria sordida]CAF1414766.1 unnamed protein product [Rotaria sordida]
MQRLEETEQERNTRLHSQAVSERTRRQLRNLQETEEERNTRLHSEAISQRTRRQVRKLQQTEKQRITDLNSEAISRRTRRQLAILKESEEQCKNRLNNQALIAANRRRTRNLQETDAIRSTRLKKEATYKMNKRRTTQDLETYDERIKRLWSNTQAETIRRNKRQQNETEEEQNYRKLCKRNADLSRNINTIQSATEIWPKIATTQIKHACLTKFKNAMSNDAVHQIVCAICACLHYKTESVKKHIGEIPNKHLLYQIDHIPSCVRRLNLDIDTTTDTFHISGKFSKYYFSKTDSFRHLYFIAEEQKQEYLSNEKDTSIIINKMLLCRKGIHLETLNAQLCRQCYTDLLSNNQPSLSLSNLMWIGNIPQELKDLTLPEQKLIALYRHSSCVVKLCSIIGDPSLAQSALKGNVITFPQNLSDIAKQLPLSLDELPHIIKIIFVGKTIPSKDQLRSILTVRREKIRTALIWLHANNILYNNIDINHLLIDTLPTNEIPD